MEEYEGEVPQQRAKGSVETNNTFIGMSERGRNLWWVNGFVGGVMEGEGDGWRGEGGREKKAKQKRKLKCLH